MSQRPDSESTSPTCYLGDVDEAYSGVRNQSGQEAVAEWRTRERQRLIDMRRMIPSEERAHKTTALIENLSRALSNVSGKMVSLYWPIRGEPDLRALRHEIDAAGGYCCLPVVSIKNHPLSFRRWDQNTVLKKGTWSLAEPTDSEEVTPDVLLAPFIGIDKNGYRLGYGGGYFDRTLASLKTPFRAIGVGFEEQRIRTIYPQPHDIPMHLVVTDKHINHGPGKDRQDDDNTKVP